MSQNTSEQNQQKPKKFLNKLNIGLIVAILTLIAALIGLASNIIPLRSPKETTVVLQEKQAPVPTSTSSTSSASYPPPGWELTINDSMKSNDGNWNEGANGSGGICKFTKYGYQISAPYPIYWTICNRLNRSFIDFAFEVQMTIVKGDT